MTEPYIGEIRAFAGNFAPVGWALCNGQLLSISQNAALFSIIGTYYGGNGVSNFALPDLQGRMLIHQGTGPGLPPFVIGQMGGSENATLLQSNLPAHSHSVTADAEAGNVGSPANALIAQNGAGRSAIAQFTNTTPTAPVTMAPNMIGVTGGSQPFSVQNPYVCITYIIALNGVFPSRG